MASPNNKYMANWYRWAQLPCILLGILFGLFITAWVGRQLSTHNLFTKFDRLHNFINIESYFYPTAREMLALAFDVADKNKINVIIGGSSVMYGVGQPKGQTLADNLRQNLGEEYRVINLATRGGSVIGFGSFVSETLIAAGYRVIFVPDAALLGYPDPIGGSPYRYFFWDVYFSVGMTPWEPRDNFIKHTMWGDQSAIGAFLNSYLYFNELWNAVHYNWLFTFPTPYVPRAFWQARINSVDQETDVPLSNRYASLKLPAEIETERSIVNDVIRLMENLTIVKDVGVAFDRALPDYLKDRTIVVYCENSPRLLRLGSSESVRIRKDAVIYFQKAVTNVKLKFIVACADFDDNDYIDRTHLSLSGAKKLAANLEKSIKTFETNR